jgi:hypothetical protein
MNSSHWTSHPGEAIWASWAELSVKDLKPKKKTESSLDGLSSWNLKVEKPVKRCLLQEGR